MSAAYFHSLEIENIRCFKGKHTLKLADENNRPHPWTIILGDNGTGKTTLLECIAGYAFDPCVFYFGQASPVTSGQRKGSYRGIIGIGNELRLQAEWSLRPLLKVEINSDRTFHAASGKVFSTAVYAYGASRRMGTATLRNEPNHNVIYFALGEDELINAEEWLLRGDYGASKESEVKDFAKKRQVQVFDVLKRIMPDVTDIRIGKPTKERLVPPVEFETPYGWVTLGQLSLGYRTMLAWMCDFAARLFQQYPDSEDPLREPAVCIVDEIDLHLHPHWQRILLSYLSERFPNVQFIATAHSPLVVQAAENANIVVLKRVGDHVEIINDPIDVRNWRVDQILTSELFGLPTARSIEYDKVLEERTRILSQPEIPESDNERLRVLDEKLSSYPVGSNAQEMRVMEFLEKFAREKQAEGQ